MAEKWTVEGDLNCWVWSGYCDSTGTPRIRTSEGNETARRVIWKREKGPIPAGKLLDPVCGNRRCVNPRHMEPVSRVEFAMICGLTELNPRLANRACKLAKAGLSGRRIAWLMAVDEATIRRILNGTHWTRRCQE